MKNNKSRIVLMVMTLLMGLGSQLLNWGAPKAEAADTGNVSVTLHKRVWDNKIPEGKQNTGNVMGDFGGTPLAGAEFTVYNVTEDFYDILGGLDTGTPTEKAKAAQEQIQAKITASTEAAPYPDPTNKVDTQTTAGTDGTAIFGALPSKTDVAGTSYDSVYVFIETKAPASVTEKAVPIILNLPITQDDNQTINTDIHLYPKNAMTSDMVKEKTNSEGIDIEDEQGNIIHTVEQGDVVSYKVTADIPSAVGDRNPDGSLVNTTMVVKDTPTEGLEKLIDTIAVEGFVKGPDYEVTENNGGFILTFKVNDNLLGKIGSKLVITYDMKLTKEAQPGVEINNHAYLTVGDVNIDTAGPTIFTGGYRFRKADDVSNVGLENAKFVVKNSKGEYLHVGADEKYTWGAKDGAYEITSGDKGYFEIARLEFGSYQLEEIAAPDGYILLANPVDFEVNMTSYLEDNRLDVQNTKKGLLPSTGGNGIAAFIAIGAVVMGAMVIFYVRNNKKARN